MCGLIYHSDSKIITFGQFYFMFHQINSRFHVPSVRSPFLPGGTLNLSIVQHYDFGRFHPISKFLTNGNLADATIGQFILKRAIKSQKIMEKKLWLKFKFKSSGEIEVKREIEHVKRTLKISNFDNPESFPI